MGSFCPRGSYINVKCADSSSLKLNCDVYIFIIIMKRFFRSEQQKTQNLFWNLDCYTCELI